MHGVGVPHHLWNLLHLLAVHRDRRPHPLQFGEWVCQVQRRRGAPGPEATESFGARSSSTCLICLAAFVPNFLSVPLPSP